MDAFPALFGKTLDELNAVAIELGLPSYTGKQLAYWLYKTGVNSFEEMTNIAKKNQQILEEHYRLGVEAPNRVSTSADGTKKYLFTAGPGKFIEADRKSVV